MIADLVAVDLDGTLLASIAAAASTPAGTRVVDRSSTGPRGVVAAEVPSLLHRLGGALVPATARDVAQLVRIDGLWRELPEWCVAAAGAVVLHHGRRVTAWDVAVRRLVAAASIGPCDVAGALHRACPSARVRIIAGAIVVAAFDRIGERATADVPPLPGWDHCWSGRKLYVAPTGIDKVHAVTAVATWTGRRRIVAAGDSALDRALLAAADVALIPGGCELDHPAVVDELGAAVVPGEPCRPGAAIARAVLAAADVPPTPWADRPVPPPPKEHP